jgi:hypothetical protein
MGTVGATMGTVGATMGAGGGGFGCHSYTVKKGPVISNLIIFG